MKKPQVIFQFRIELTDISPTIWRRIQVPMEYSFWNFHVAIQDAMGWQDTHLHEFRLPVPDSKREYVAIGIPDPDFPEHDLLPGWETLIDDFFDRPGEALTYLYDFGDGWHHHVFLEAILLGEAKTKYPLCLDGARACPPEDCGGAYGYAELLETLSDPANEGYEETQNWLRGNSKSKTSFDAERFDPQNIKFASPKRRFKQCFGE